MKSKISNGMKKYLKTISYLIVSILVGVTAVYAGDLTPPGAPAKTMKSLADLYQLTDTGANTPSTSFTTPAYNPPTGTMNSLESIYDLLTSKIAYINTNEASILSSISPFGIKGTMSNIGAQNITPSTSNQTITQGYHNGSGTVAGDADLIASNIKKDTVLFGVTGNLEGIDTSSGDATAEHILAGKKAWVDGVEVTGTIPTQTLSNANDTVSAGYYEATTLAGVDTDLTSANIKSGVTLFGVEGDTNVVNTSSGDAITTDILIGKKAWVDGAEVTGTATTGGSYGLPKTGQTICYDVSGGVISCTNGDTALGGQDGYY